MTIMFEEWEKTKMKDERKKYWRFSQTQIEGIVFAGYF